MVLSRKPVHEGLTRIERLVRVVLVDLLKVRRRRGRMIIMAQVELVVIMVSRLRIASLRPTLAHKRRKARIAAVELGLRRWHQSLVLVLVMHMLVLSVRRPREQRLVVDSLLLFGFDLVHGD